MKPSELLINSIKSVLDLNQSRRKRNHLSLRKKTPLSRSRKRFPSSSKSQSQSRKSLRSKRMTARTGSMLMILSRRWRSLKGCGSSLLILTQVDSQPNLSKQLLQPRRRRRLARNQLKPKSSRTYLMIQKNHRSKARTSSRLMMSLTRVRGMTRCSTRNGRRLKK